MFAKLTYQNQDGRKSAEVHLAVSQIVAISPANPSGTLVGTVRGNHLVAQSVEQVLTAVYKAHTGI